jgi:hypothetical protein
VRKKGLNHVQSNGRSHQTPSAKKPEKGNSPVLMLPPGSYERLALRNPRVLFQKHGAHARCTSAKKLVSSYFAKILEVATKIRETCEKTLFTPPSPIKATNSIVSVEAIRGRQNRQHKFSDRPSQNCQRAFSDTT